MRADRRRHRESKHSCRVAVACRAPGSGGPGAVGGRAASSGVAKLPAAAPSKTSTPLVSRIRAIAVLIISIGVEDVGAQYRPASADDDRCPPSVIWPDMIKSAEG